VSICLVEIINNNNNNNKVHLYLTEFNSATKRGSKEGTVQESGCFLNRGMCGYLFGCNVSIYGYVHCEHVGICAYIHV